MNTPYDPFDAIALGLPRPAQQAAAPTAPTAQAATRAAELARCTPLQYALARQVPDMKHGFIIVTNYGDIAIPAGWAADFIADQVRMALGAELLALVPKVPA